MNDVLNRIQNYALEEIMGDRFSKYAKEIIQDRAIPDVRDGLKPVQRRILYTMHQTNNSHDKGYVKCAFTVGGVLGKYHPHGDSSVYDAMVRMSQWWKQNHILVDIHGNNGSMDGDPAAAYRYTEARLAKISGELLKDLDKNTVSWSPNFDDRFLEPTVLPAKFPNLLVNGASGISAGYATNIPAHNLGEIIDACIKRIDSPNMTIDTLLKIVLGPDFPTGGTVYGQTGIKDAFMTGKGRVVIRSKYEIVKNKNREQIVITEIPFEVNKAVFVSKMDGIRIDKKLEGISEVRDETDRTGLRIAIDLKAGANAEHIVNYLLKNTEMQVSYNYNMVAIVNRTPKILSIFEILDAYLAHQKDFITKRTEFDLAYFKKRHVIVEGLIKAISVLDEVIVIIRGSKNKKDAENNLVARFQFLPEQAEAIVLLQLYKLTNTDVCILEEEAEKLKAAIAGLEEILGSDEKLKSVMKLELKNIKKEYATPRKSVIAGEIEDIKIDVKEMIPVENVAVAVTREGYIKRSSYKSYVSSDGESALKPGDFVVNTFLATTQNTLLVFTNLGNYLYIPIHKVPDQKWKDLAKHINNIISLEPEEKVIKSFIYEDDKILAFFTKNGLAKKVLMKDLEVTRFSKAMTSFKLKENDEVVNVEENYNDCIIITQNGNYVKYGTDELPLAGAKASGVKAVSLKDDLVVSASTIKESDEYLNIFTNFNTAKRLKISELNIHSRAKKGSGLYKTIKTKNYQVVSAFVGDTKDMYLTVNGTEVKESKCVDIPIMDILSTGSNISKNNIDIIVKNNPLEDLINKKKTPESKVEDKELLPEQPTFKDFSEDFKI